ncbi:MAG: glycerate kinase, partial [Clostridia bacterium]|nr:glycerate kinase [Clostridia bacterium]
NEIDSFFGILADGRTAVIEMAAASGLMLVPKNHRNPMNTTTYGTGQLMLKAIEHGCADIIIGVGGSATNDGGMGMAQALGIVFFDAARKPLSYAGRHMGRIKYYVDTGLDHRIRKANITVACDVTNPFYGESGAAYVYARQKGAGSRQVRALDKGLRNMAMVIKETSGFDVNMIAGAGAAGGLAGGLAAFAGAKLKKGFDIVADACRLEEHIRDADLVVTGEGMTDAQTAFGKAPAGVAAIAKKYNVPVICISGSLGDGYEDVYKEGISAVFSICPGPMSLQESIKNAGKFISATACDAARLFAAGR